MANLLFAFLVACSLSFAAVAQENHSHSHSHARDFGSIDEGWIALEDVTAKIRAAVKAGNMAALHDLSADLHGVADGLASHEDDVPKPNRLRFTSSLNQLRSLSDRFHAAHESNDVAAAERMVPQLNGMVQLLMVSAEGR